MKNKCYSVFFFVCFFCSACASTKQLNTDVEKTEWISSQNRYQIFPDSEYLSYIGYGSTELECKDRAIAGISQYIKTTVDSSTEFGYSFKEFGDDYTENSFLKQTIHVSSANNLFQLEYTDPYYDEDRDQFSCVAYINRERAFNFVRPKLENAKKQFPESYRYYLTKESSLDKIIGIRQAWKVLPDFYEVYDFARAIMPDKTKAYEEIDFLARQSLMTMKELCSAIQIRIQGTGDTTLLEDSGVISELSNQFKNIGFIVGNSQKANCIVLVEIKSAITETQDTFQSYPEISIKMLEQGIEKVSYIKKLSKVAGFDKDTVIRRIKIALTEDIKQSFIKECF